MNKETFPYESYTDTPISEEDMELLLKEILKEWSEEGHPRGVSVEGTNSGSFTSKEFAQALKDFSNNPLNARLVDYKADRKLVDAKHSVSIKGLLPSVSYTSYADVPFLRSLHTGMGVEDPFTIPVMEYMKRRDDFFNEMPTVDVHLQNVVVTQPSVNDDRVHEIRENHDAGGNRPILAVKYDAKTYILNGHNRLAAFILDGHDWIKGKLWDMDKPGLGGILKFNPNHDELGRFTFSGEAQLGIQPPDEKKLEFDPEETPVGGERVDYSHVPMGGMSNFKIMREAAAARDSQFKAWFGDSKVVDALGAPLRVFHGTKGQIGSFDEAGAYQARSGNAPSKAYFFSSDSKSAEGYALEGGKEGANIVPVYLSIQKPLLIDAKGSDWDNILWGKDSGGDDEYYDIDDLTRLTKVRNRYDGIIVRNVVDNKDMGRNRNPAATYVVFNSTQIKSAVGNKGTFDPKNPDITKAELPAPILSWL